MSLLLFLLVFVSLRIAAPYVVSTRMVRSGIENALSEWTGFRAEIAGQSFVDFWPSPRITLHQIAIRNKADNNRILGTIDSLSAEFSILDALFGRTSFHEFNLVRPNLLLRRDDSGLIDWTNHGLLSNAINKAYRRDGNQALDRNLDAAVGRITVEDGILSVEDVTSGRVFHFDSVSADIGWRKLSRKMDAVLIARTNGQDFKLSFSSAAPLLFFGGKNADVDLAVSSPLVTSAFRGTGNMHGLADLDGHLSLTIPDVPDLSRWADNALPGIEALRSFSFESNIQAVGHGMRFDNTSLKMNNASATGVLDFSFAPGRDPKLGGTLAFDLMNLKPLLDAFTLRLAAGEPEGPPEGGLLQKLDIDLRLSAKEAEYDLFNLQNVAASIIVSANEAKLDIGDSRFEGGDLVARLEATRGDFDGGGKLQMTVRDADFSAVVEKLHPPGPLPLGNGSLELDVQTTRPIWAAKPEDLTGNLSFEATSGTLPGIDIDAIRSQAEKSQFFPLSMATSRAFAFDSMSLEARIKDGAAEISDARIVGPSQTMVLSGVVPYDSGGLALSGSLLGTDPTKMSEYPALPFFVGGSWAKPVISPIPGAAGTATK